MDLNDVYAADLDGALWVKSTYTGNNGDCVETAEVPGFAAMAVRDSKNPHLPATRVSQAAWDNFIAAAKARHLTQA